jgi:hypothetical protein
MMFFAADADGTSPTGRKQALRIGNRGTVPCHLLTPGK